MPSELVHKIMADLDDAGQHATLAVVMRTTKALYDHVAPLVYRKVAITHDNAESFYRGLAAPPSRRRRAKEKVDRGITWAEFKHPNHYLDWAAGNDWGHNENLRHKTLYAVWPLGEIDSDDSDCDTTEDTPSYAYPTPASSRRKRNLLSKVRSLQIKDVPPRHLSLALNQLIKHRYLPELVPDTFSGTRSSLCTLSISPRAVWKFVDYHDRHGYSHPFLDFLSVQCVPHICIQLPIVDSHLEKAYMISRIVPLDEHHSRSDSVDQFTYLRRRLRELLNPGSSLTNSSTFGADLHQWFASQYTRSLTIHNQVPTAHSPFGARSFRVFHRPCPCRDPSITDQIDDGFCYNHFEPTTLPTRVVPSLHPEQRQAEFIDLDWVSGSQEGPRDPAILDHTLRAIQHAVEEERNPQAVIFPLASAQPGGMRQREADEKVTATTAAETAQCVCCGQHQLDGTMVSRCSSQRCFPSPIAFVSLLHRLCCANGKRAPSSSLPLFDCHPRVYESNTPTSD